MRVNSRISKIITKIVKLGFFILLAIFLQRREIIAYFEHSFLVKSRPGKNLVFDYILMILLNFEVKFLLRGHPVALESRMVKA